MILLSTAYFAPVQYYSKLLNGQPVIERHEHYSKQTYRNRCSVYSANGVLDLAVPTVKAREPKIMIAEVEIAYDTLWQKQHFKAIESAYRRSPFYEYYIDDLLVFFNRRHRYLYDFNMQIMHTVCSLAKIPLRVQESRDYMQPVDGMADFRNSIHPKVDWREADPAFVAPRYTQVFAGKWGFKPNLSILDMLFNVGPETKDLL